MEKKSDLYKYIYAFIGASILSFGIYNVHHYCGITEGGELGVELLLKHWFDISPAITSVIIDLIAYGLGLKILGRHFLKFALVSTISYSITYTFWSSFSPFFPDLINHPLLTALLGALFVGIGSGMVIRVGGACSGDDAIALILSNRLHTNISLCYLFTDLTVLLLSLSYIPFSKIIYSLITVTLSSYIIGLFQKED